ncbi:MAG: adenylate/guanylate cyclase domain-containing protein [Sideroxydans sp.]|nr:adenylate/guanylate cyclase domain-containing protein [Sideroxydans sp.]NOT98391.1 adenylate/guanylate cyclase domain-containing protein [Sideroxydans sp.]
MEQRNNKTIICSVFFLDIVEYSKKSVAGQISLKERFNAFLSIAIRDVPVNDRIILDTGDGAAISFLGDIEDALQAALSMRSSLLGEGVRMEPTLLVRMGINLGPVRLVKDINGQPNIVGDGINVAQRVMGFADTGQVLVSRSYYDAVSRLSSEYSGMFHYQGSRTDKHVREHEVYAIGYPGDFTSTQRSVALQEQVEHSTGWRHVLAQSQIVWASSIHQVALWERRGISAFRRITTPQKVAVLSVAAIFAFSMMLGIYKLAHRPAVPAVKKVAVTASDKPTLPMSAPVAASAVVVDAQKAAEIEANKKVQGVKQSSRVRTLAETTGGPAVVGLSIVPWGEVYLDGVLQGVSPPLLELQVVSGQHKLEIRNSNFPVLKQTIKAKPGEKIKIKHSFK